MTLARELEMNDLTLQRRAEGSQHRGWMADAACRGMGPDLFYADDRSPEQKAALQICAGCPVKAECLEAALEYGEEQGVWGGYVSHKMRGRARIRARVA